MKPEKKINAIDTPLHEICVQKFRRQQQQYGGGGGSIYPRRKNQPSLRTSGYKRRSNLILWRDHLSAFVVTNKLMF